MNLTNEFLTLLIKICVGFEVLTAIVGTIFYNKYRRTPFLRYFLYLLWYVAANELIGLYIRLDNGINAIIYNIYHVINFSFFFFLYRYYLINIKNKKLVFTLCIIYIISFVINGFYENYLVKHQSFPYIIASFFLVVTIILYFFEVLNSEKVLNAKKNLLIWISFGLLIYFVGNLPFRILRNYYAELTDATVSFLVKFTVTIVMNTCFIIGFIWSDKKQQY